MLKLLLLVHYKVDSIVIYDQMAFEIIGFNSSLVGSLRINMNLKFLLQDRNFTIHIHIIYIYMYMESKY